MEESIGDFDDMSNADKDQIIEKCENAKISLSDEDYEKFQLIDYGSKGVKRFTITYEMFKEIIQPQIEEAIKTLLTAVDKAGTSLAQLNAIIMVGGSCKMRPIQKAMELFEIKNIKIIYPKNMQHMQWVVSMGAAKVGKYNTSYRMSHSIGVILSDDEFLPIIEKGSAIPYKVDEIRFGVVEETMDAHFIITDEQKRQLKIVNVPVKGFTTEGISLNAEIDENMIANITLKSTYMGNHAKRSIEIQNLSFYYDFNIDYTIKTKEPGANKWNQIDLGGSETATNGTNIAFKKCLYCDLEATHGNFCRDHYKYERVESH